MLAKKNRLQTIKGIVLLILFVSYVAGINFFPHKHIIDGKVVVHSHPFSATEHHTHSTGTIQLIQLLSAFVTNAIGSLTAVMILHSCIHRLSEEVFNNTISLAVFQKLYQRPPPAV